MKIAVTGGAGFIGSHLTDSLIAEGHEVLVIDDLSSGKKEHVNPKAGFLKKDIRDGLSAELKGAEAVFHLAADPDVRSSMVNPQKTFDINVRGTYSLLEDCRKADVKEFLFASSSAVYGETMEIPTPEDHPCIPISNYGASKVAGEAYLSSFCFSYGIRGTSLRYANIFGERSSRGVMYDFFQKLKQNPEKLQILGDGKQSKSYLHVSDCVSATLIAWKEQESKYDVFNVGSRERIDVDEIANLIAKHTKTDPEFNYTGTPRGWAGDIPITHLDISKLENLGWKSKIPFEVGMDRYMAFLTSPSH